VEAEAEEPDLPRGLLDRHRVVILPQTIVQATFSR
jgi:hypothetical protein